MANTPPILPVRGTRGSAPITAELFGATADPLVLAFQAQVLFHDSAAAGPLTLPQLRARWKASERGASAARRALIDSGFWVEIDARQPAGTFRKETLFSEARLREDDLAEVAAQYAPSSRIRCGGADYLVGPNGELKHRDRISADSASISAGRAETAPAQTRTNGTDPAPLQTRRDQDPLSADPAVVQGRRDQEQQHNPAGRTDPAPLQTDASSSLRDDDEMHACMHEFWQQITTTVATVDPKGRASVKAQVRTALETVWTPEGLVAWVQKQVADAKRRGGVHRPGGFVVSLLREIPTPTEATGPGRHHSPDRPAWCGADGSDQRDRCDERTRFRERRSDNIPYRCPECHPQSQSSPGRAA